MFGQEWDEEEEEQRLYRYPIPPPPDGGNGNGAEKRVGEIYPQDPMITGATVTELATALDQMENSLEEGGRAKLQLIDQVLPTQQELNETYNSLIAAGFHVTMPTASMQDGWAVTEMILTKGSPFWSLLIPLIPTIMITGLVAFGITQIETITSALMPLLLIGGGLVIGALALLTRPGVTKVAEKYVSR